MIKSINFDEFPQLPGVYFFKDAHNNVLYIGKAISIRDRVKSYFQKNKQDWKVNFLLQEAKTVDFIITSSEEEALVLEAQLVKENQPKFNVLLKEGNPFVYFLITDEPLPRLELVRQKKRKGTYFGPCINKQQAKHVYAYLLRYFQLKICNKHIAQGCLDYHLGFCAGACRDDFSLETYLFRLELVKQLLKKDTNLFKRMILDEMNEAIKTLHFERAAHLRSYLESLATITEYIENAYNPKTYQMEFLYKTSALSQQEIRAEDIGYLLKEFLNLSYEPKTVDCFDISHFQGNWIVGSCVRFTNGLPEKNKFRRFNIKTLENQNDYAALQEIVQRRYTKEALPDIVLIDGGKGQLSAVKKVMPNAYLLALAKREETLFGPGFMQGKKLDLKSEVGLFFVGLRDYAHHFAITHHRKRRSKYNV